MQRRLPLERAGSAARVATAFVVALVAAWFLQDLVTALRLGSKGSVAPQHRAGTGTGIDAHRREALGWRNYLSWTGYGEFTAEGRLRFSQHRVRGRFFAEEFRPLAAAEVPSLGTPYSLRVDDTSMVSWRLVEAMARPGPGLSGAVVESLSRGDHVAEGWLYDPRHQCLAGLQADDGKSLGFVGSNGFADSPEAAGPLGDFRLYGSVFECGQRHTVLLLWLSSTGLRVIDPANRIVVQLTAQEIPWSHLKQAFPGPFGEGAHGQSAGRSSSSAALPPSTDTAWAQLNQALLAGITPPVLCPFAAWCRRLVPAPMSSAFSDTERYRPPLERFGRQFGWAYPLSAWQVPWAALFAGGVFLHARKRGTPLRTTLAWGVAAAAFGLAGALAYALTRPAVSGPGPVAAPAALPVLRDPQET